MILMGRYLSPFVRRVAVSMRIYAIPYEHRSIIAFGEGKAALRSANPITRVPVLVLDDGETLIESAAILDYLDERVGPEKALTPPSGEARRRVLKLLGVATGAVEKAIHTVWEKRFRPEEKQHAPWVEMCATQAKDGFEYLDHQAVMPWMTGAAMTQADVTAIVCHEFVKVANPELAAGFDCPRIEEITQRVAERPEFVATVPDE